MPYLANLTPEHRRILYVAVLAVAIAALVTVLVTVPIVTNTESYHVTSPCQPGQVGASCAFALTFTSPWNSRVTVSWSTPSPMAMGSAITICSGPGTVLVYGGSSGSFSFMSAGGQTVCTFDGTTWSNVSIFHALL